MGSFFDEIKDLPMYTGVVYENNKWRKAKEGEQPHGHIRWDNGNQSINATGHIINNKLVFGNKM